MRRKKNLFGSAKELDTLITQYFGQMAEEKPVAPAEPVTLTGLAFHLGFSSREAFEEYEQSGKFADHLKRARLRIIADYEKKLHGSSSAGAIFALKSMGWNEKSDQKPAAVPDNHVLKVEIIKTGPPLSFAETEITI